MRTQWHDLWGSGRGPLGRLAPQVRLLAGAGVGLASLLAPADQWSGALFCFTGAGIWLIACRPPARQMRQLLLLGLAFFLPYFLLTPLIYYGQPLDRSSWTTAWAIPWRVFCRGYCTLIISVSTLTTLCLTDFHRGLWRLPLPAPLVAIVAQILQQVGTLLHESRQIATAMAFRGAAGRGVAVWRLVRGLPRVWLPRVACRAERVALAMAWRNYGGSRMDLDPAPWRRAEVLTLTGVAGWILLAIYLRMQAVA